MLTSESTDAKQTIQSVDKQPAVAARQMNIAVKRLHKLFDLALHFQAGSHESDRDLLIRDIDDEFGRYRTFFESDHAIGLDEEMEKQFFGLDDLVRTAKSRLRRATVTGLKSDSDSSEAFRELIKAQTKVLSDLAVQRIQMNGARCLPDLEVPKFSGNAREWLTFRDMFLSTVDMNEDLTPVQKLQYLKNSLVGEAASIVRTIPITDANYKIAWDNVVAAYNRPSLILESIFDQFLRCEKVNSCHTNIRTVYNVFRETIEFLSNEGQYAASRDPIMIYLMVKKLDPETDLAWAKHSRANATPTLEYFLNFLNDRCTIQQRVDHTDHGRVRHHPSKSPSRYGGPKNQVRINTMGPFSCFHCKESHSIYKCPRFMALSISDRERALSTEGRCYNCLSRGHSVKSCKSLKNCSVCRRRHNTLLHGVRSGSPAKTAEAKLDSSHLSTETPNQSKSPVVQLNVSLMPSSLLPTALVRVHGTNGGSVLARVLIDTGAQASLISEGLVDRLDLPRSNVRVPITCLTNSSRLSTRGRTSIHFSSTISEGKTFSVNAHILPRLLGLLPQHDCPVSSLEDLKSQFRLADPNFNKPNHIDMILGASFLFEILKPSLFFHTIDRLYLQDTCLGYVVCGKQETFSDVSLNSFSVISDNAGDETLERFWALEEVPISESNLDHDDRACESIFRESTTRLASGRFCVKLPYKHDVSKLGDSVQIAYRRLCQLERKLIKTPDHYQAYHDFMSEYESLGHMSLTNYTLSTLPKHSYVIPHHGVYQKNQSNSKLRVVFDASAKSSSGISLNDILHVGPKLQNDLSIIMIRFRIPRFVLMADVVKMYRQILVHPDDRDRQLILWRVNPLDPVSIYQLSTVTYGQSCSPYLAIRCLRELANLEGSHYPRGADVLLNHTYVDDILFGHDDRTELMSIRHELTDLLDRGGFSLKKWAANDSQLLIGHDDLGLADKYLFSEKLDNSIKTLGTTWYPSRDQLSYRIADSELGDPTKRSLLSTTAKLYDPLGLVSPVIIKLKYLFQQTWIRGIGWDSPLPEDMIREWHSIFRELSSLDELRIDRHFGSGLTELHGFSDASRIAYAASVYVRVVDFDGGVRVSLVMSKTKLAPIKPLSIPKLELCAAHLLAKLVTHVGHAFPRSKVVLWSDSTTVLAWIKALPKTWNSFVANRVSNIAELCPKVRWCHVRSNQNPADIASRGLSPRQLLSSSLWWHGPDYLRDSCFQLPHDEVFETSEEMSRAFVAGVAFIPTEFWNVVIERFSNLNRLIRSIAYVFRVFKVRQVHEYIDLNVSAREFTDALRFIIGRIQHYHFADEIRRLTSKAQIAKSSRIRALSPFLDDQCILRVGGRLQNNRDESFNATPILIPNCKFAELLIRRTHIDTLHGGCTIVCSKLRETYWILNIRKSVKRLVRGCNRCVRYASSTYAPIMGQLPSYRVSANKPFLITGLDFAGPLSLRPYRSRGTSTVKCYIALFICCATKALHLELIMSLSVESLILGLKRFIARRGRCERLITDNGRNFTGCQRSFIEFRRSLENSIGDATLKSHLANSMITWDFIPAYSPHFGGIWEAGVRSVKYHLYRSYNGTQLTIEEAVTFLCEVESVLNSRPLSPLNFTDVDTPITPSHLLTGEAVSQIPEILTPVQATSDVRARFNVIRNLTRAFWHRWRSEYLSTLVRKSKWIRDNPNPQLSDVVYIKRPSEPPRSWAIGRIVRLYPGSDGVCRVVDVRSRGLVRRESTRNLIPLLVDSSESTGGLC